MRHWFADLAFPWWMYATAIACLAGQAGCVGHAFRQWRAKPWLVVPPQGPDSWPAMAISFLGLAWLAVVIGFVEPSRRTLIALAVGPPRLDMPSAVLYASSKQRLGLLSYFPAWMAVSAILGALALTCQVSTRWKTMTARERGETRPGWYAPRTGEVGVAVLGFAVAAVAPFLLGIWLFDRRIDAALDTAAQASLGEQGAVLLKGFASARRALTFASLASVVGLVLTFGVAMLFLRRWQSQGMTWPRADRRPWRTLRGCALLVVLGGAFVWGTRPFRAENYTPWPPEALDSDRVWPALPDASPNLSSLPQEFRVQQRLRGGIRPFKGSLIPGTAAGVRGTALIEISSNGFTVVGHSPVPLSDLRRELQEAINNQTLLHPGDNERESLIVLADRDVDGKTVADALLAAYDAGYRQADLVSFRLETIVRPTLGPLSRVHRTSTPARLERSSSRGDADGSRTQLSCRNFRRFEELLSSAIKVVRSGNAVALTVSEEQSTPLRP